LTECAEMDLAEITKLIPGYDPYATAGPGMYFDEAAAQLALDFFPEFLQFIEGSKAGQPFVLEPWEAAFVANLFGWKRKNGLRRYRRCILFVPRKNGKTPIAAGVGLYVLFVDDEAGAQNYCAGADRDQAVLVFRHANHMANADEDLSAKSRCFTSTKTLVKLDGSGNETASFFRAISADDKTKHGYNIHLVIVDELHTQPNRDLVDTLVTGTANRDQPIILFITTSDYDHPSICNEEYDYATKVRDGIIDDPSYLPVIYEASIDDDWTDPEIWAKANPNLGVSVSLDYLERACKRAQESPAFENTFKRLHLNIRTEQDVRWLQMDKWDECAGAIEDVDGQECFAGVDLATTTDIAAALFYFPHNGAVVSRFWIPEESAHKRERRDRVPYLTWAREGLVKLTAGNVIDYDVIREDIRELGTQFNIREIAIDRWNSTQLTTQLAGDGFEMVPFGQGFASMSAPTKELEKLVLGGKIAHGGNAVLRWMASNVSVEMDAAGNLKPSKKKSTEKIDGMVALVMAIGRAISSDGKPSGSIYNTPERARGLVTV